MFAAQCLVAIMECYGCHSKSVSSANRQSPEKTPGYMAGGERLISADGQVIKGANLTPDKASGIGRWTAKQFISAMRDGERPDGSRLRAPMPRYPQLSEPDLLAIYAYLMSLSAVVKP